MASKVLSIISAAIVMGHGLIHLMGVSVYLGLAEIEGLACKTTLLDGRWDLGTTGIRWFGKLWLIAVTGFVTGAIGMITHRDSCIPVLLTTSLVSLAITALDYTTASAGVLVNLLILTGLYISAHMK